MRLRLRLALLIPLLATPGRVSADFIRYSLLVPGDQVLATVDVASPPASESSGWSASSSDTLLWRIFLQYTATGPQWVEASGHFPITSNTGRQLDSGSGTIFAPSDPQPSIFVTLSPNGNQDEIVIYYAPSVIVTYRGNFLSPSALAAVPESSPLVLGGALSMVGVALAGWRRWRAGRA